jgi:hypothetical protein
VLAVEWYVDASVATPGNGLSWDEAFLTISEGVAAASDGDTVLVAPGIYAEGRLRVWNSVTVQSTDPEDASVISATVIKDTAVEVVHILRGFTIRGGGVLCGSRTVAIVSNIICDGSGISCTVSSATVSGNVLANNVNGGIRCDHSSVTIGNNIIVKNKTQAVGGAIYCHRSSPLILNNTIVGNTVGGNPSGLNAG